MGRFAIKLFQVFLLFILFFIIQANAASAQCVDLSGLNEYIVNESVEICPGTYYMNDTDNDGVIIINADNITLDCNGSTIVGNGSGSGIGATNHNNITIENCIVKNYS